MNNDLEDNALYEDESTDMTEPTEPASHKSNKNSRSAAEQDEDEDDYMDEDAAPEPTFPAHLSIVIEKVLNQSLHS